MNPEQIKNAVVDLIKDRPSSNTGKWYLCWKEKKLRLISTSDDKKNLRIFAVINLREVREGLTGTKWTQIGSDIARHIEKERTCPNPPKP